MRSLWVRTTSPRMYLRWAQQWTQWIFDDDLIDQTSVAWIPADIHSVNPVIGRGQGYKEGSDCTNGHDISVDITQMDMQPVQPCTAGTVYSVRETALVDSCCPPGAATCPPETCAPQCQASALSFFRDCEAVFSTLPLAIQEQLSSLRVSCHAH